MKHSRTQYASALVESLEGAPAAERRNRARRFFSILVRNGDWRELPAILRHAERLSRVRAGVRTVEVKSSASLSPAVRTEIKTLMGPRALITESVEPQLLAGLTMLIDQDVFVDASAASRIRHLFPRRAPANSL